MTYEKTHVHASGARISGPASVVDASIRYEQDQQRQKAEWIGLLRSQGVKAAHPDDGWVDREANRAHLVYPQFDDAPEVGDTIALGWPRKHRLVVVTAVTVNRRWVGSGPPTRTYDFEEVDGGR